MASVIPVDLVSIEVTPKLVVLNLKGNRGQRYTKSFPRADFELMSRPLAAGQPGALIRLGFRRDGASDRLIARLDDGSLANMGDLTAEGSGVAFDLILMMMADKKREGHLLTAMAKGSPLTVPNPHRGK